METIARGVRGRLLLGLAIGGPALALGGTPPWTVPVFAALVAALLATLVRRTSLRLPSVAVLGLFAAGMCVLQVAPIPGLRSTLAPALDDWIVRAAGGIEGGWPSLSPAPADTALEVVRVLALVGLAVVAAQRSWRCTAAAVALTGALVAGIGLVQYGLGIDQIYGLYEAKHGARELSPALLSTFVSPNHQSGLLLVGLCATVGLLADTRVPRYESQRLDRRVALGIALILQVAALVLSMSRAALVVAMLIAPLAALIVWWPEARGERRIRQVAPAAAGILVVSGIAIGLSTLGAWHELSTLRMADGLDSSTAARLRVTLASVDLVELAPLTGIGRGAYGDVFTAFDPAPNHVWYSHLECAPLALVVEWGVLGGGLLALLLPTWWLVAMRRAGEHEDARARRVVLLGLLAVALQGLADFSLEFIGVGAPVAALAGALDGSGAGHRSLRPSHGRWGAVVLGGLAVVSMMLVPRTWSYRGQSGSVDAEVAVAQRPLDASRHRQLAREAAAGDDWATARARARIAIRLSPGQPDGWLLLAAAAHAEGDGSAKLNATAEALARIHAPPSDALLEYLVDGFERPTTLARLTPREPEARRLLVRGLLGRSPAHADAMAGVWSEREPSDPEALQMRVEANLRLERPGLALHHARLWRQLVPTDARAHLGVARALQISPRPRPTDIRDALMRALAEARIDDLHDRGLIEEQLLRALLGLPGPEARQQAMEIARALRTRPADPIVRRRWRELFLPVLEG